MILHPLFPLIQWSAFLWTKMISVFQLGAQCTNRISITAIVGYFDHRPITGHYKQNHGPAIATIAFDTEVGVDKFITCCQQAGQHVGIWGHRFLF